MEKEWLDKKISEISGNNDQTFREFIRESEDAFGLNERNLNPMTSEELTEYLDWLDDLWNK